MKFKEEQIPLNSLKELGLHDATTNLLPLEIKEQLLRGELSDFVQLRNIPVNGEHISIDAKLSLRERADGSISLLIHPIYSKKQNHDLLTDEENQLFQQSGVHTKSVSSFGKIVDFGKANYKFIEDAKESFFIRLEKTNGHISEIWGKDLERALQESGKQIGDNVQLHFKGAEAVTVQADIRDAEGKKIGEKQISTNRNSWEISDYVPERKDERYLLFEYDEETKSFVGVDADEVNIPEAINGMNLTPEQKRAFKEGKVVTFPDDTQIQVSPASKNSLKANKRWLIASVLFDGGISFVMFHILKKLIKSKQPKDQSYEKGYLDALNKVKADLQKKQARYPNNKQIENDLNILGQEISRANKGAKEQVNDKNIKEVKTKVNDPELVANATRQEKNEENEKTVAENKSTEQKSTKEASEENIKSQGYRK